MKIVTVSSIKGGVGKTSLCVFLSQALANSGRVLSVDMDANNNLTDYILRDTDSGEIEERNLYHAISGSISVGDAIWSGPSDVIPCTMTLNRVAIELVSKPAAMLKFCKGLRALDYDFIVIDTPPHLTYELRTALHCADIVLTPVSTSRWTLQAYGLLQSELAEIHDGTPPPLYAVPSIVTEKENEAMRSGPLDFSKAYVKKMASIKNAIDTGTPLASKPAIELFYQLAGEVIKWLKH